MCLTHAVSMVTGLKEAMWEELKELIKNERESLSTTYGWDESDFDHPEGAPREFGASRAKFDSMLEQYKRYHIF